MDVTAMDLSLLGVEQERIARRLDCVGREPVELKGIIV
jgi:hypothetical protein